MDADDDTTALLAAQILDASTAWRGGDSERCTELLDVLLKGTSLAPPLRTLVLHLSALAAFAAGRADDGRDHLAAAATLEREAGARLAAEHSSHAAVLLGHLGGDLRAARDYYTTTFRTVHAMNNRRGMAQTLRSLGELALLHHRPEQARSCWARAHGLLVELGLPDAALLEAWLALAEGL